MACAIAPQDRFHRQAKPRLPHAPPSRLCAASATPASRSPASSASRRRPSAASFRRLGLNRLSRARAGRAGPPLRARASRRADPHRHQEARPFQPGRPSHHRRPHRPEQQPRRRLGVRPRLHRRCLPPRLLADPARREEGSAVAFLKAAVAYYASLGVNVERVMTDNGSCYKSFAFRQSLQATRPQAHPHQALHAQDQRQGRALHPDRAARMGLRSRLPQLRPATRQQLPIWLHRYNWHRPHGGIG